MKTKESKSLKNNELSNNKDNGVSKRSMEVNAGTIRLNDIVVPKGIKSITRAAKDLSISLKGCMIMYRESITPCAAEKGNDRISDYNKKIRERRNQLGVDATKLLMNPRLAMRYVVRALPKVDGQFVTECTVYSESLNKEGAIVITDTRNEAIPLGTMVLCNDGNTSLRNTIEEPTIGDNGLKKIKGWKPVKKYTIAYVERFIQYAVDMWIADGRPSK